jgi:hypothetical protein
MNTHEKIMNLHNYIRAIIKVTDEIICLKKRPRGRLPDPPEDQQLFKYADKLLKAICILHEVMGEINKDIDALYPDGGRTAIYYKGSLISRD